MYNIINMYIVVYKKLTQKAEKAYNKKADQSTGTMQTSEFLQLVYIN